MSWFLVSVTIGLTIFCQLVTKWRVLEAGPMPANMNDKFFFILKLSLSPWMISVFVLLFVASMCWMGAMTRLPLNTAYPFTSLSFIFVLFLSAYFFNEPVAWTKIFGLILIIAGLVISSRG